MTPLPELAIWSYNMVWLFLNRTGRRRHSRTIYASLEPLCKFNLLSMHHSAEFNKHFRAIIYSPLSLVLNAGWMNLRYTYNSLLQIELLAVYNVNWGELRKHPAVRARQWVQLLLLPWQRHCMTSRHDHHRLTNCSFNRPLLIYFGIAMILLHWACRKIPQLWHACKPMPDVQLGLINFGNLSWITTSSGLLLLFTRQPPALYRHKYGIFWIQTGRLDW